MILRGAIASQKTLQKFLSVTITAQNAFSNSIDGQTCLLQGL